MVPRFVASAVERGRLDGRVARAVAYLWGRAADQRLATNDLPPTVVPTVSVLGATLGGSGKTPVAAAFAAAFGEGAVLVGHGYGGRLRSVRWVEPTDDPRIAGDEAVATARGLGPSGARVVVGPTRREAFAEAALMARTAIVVDGGAYRARAGLLRILAIDLRAAPPSGCPPRGDLRASISALASAVDAVACVRDDETVGTLGRWLEHLPAALPQIFVRRRSRGAWRGQNLLPYAELRKVRLGLATALARPERVVQSLARVGIHLAVVASGRDHRPPSLPRRAPVDLWLATPKCAAHFGHRCDVARLDEELFLEPSSHPFFIPPR